MGPTGAPGAAASELVDAFTEQALALRRGGVQALVVETMTAVDEAAIAVRCAAAAGLQVVASFTFGWGDDGCSTLAGVTPATATAEMLRAGAGALGANCGNSIAEFERVVALYREVWSGPLWIKPSAGLPRLVGGAFVYDLTPEAFAGSMRRIVAAGANIVGGCCGVTPDFIRALTGRVASAGGGPGGPAPRST
jgi:methionine synthase I (cobalamin-dependent)